MSTTFDMVDGLLDTESAISLMEVGVREGNVGDVAKVIAGRFALRPKAVIEWYTEVLNRRVQEATAILEKLRELTMCRLGRCLTKDSHYKGGDQTVFDKVKNGICPICGGPLAKTGERSDARSQ